MRSLFFSFFICLIIAHTVRATTWDEPWHVEVMRNSDSFVKVRVLENQGSKVKVNLIKLLAGMSTPLQIELGSYSRLKLISISPGSSELRLPFRLGQVYYLFIRKSEKTNSYQLPTPTSGYAKLENGNVYSTYRHSYHQALVPEQRYMRKPCRKYSTVLRGSNLMWSLSRNS